MLELKPNPSVFKPNQNEAIMQYRKIGNSDLELSVVTFGAWAAGGWMWGGTEQNDSVNAIRAAIDMGVTSIDTAPVYGQGLSEQIVGEAIQGIPRDKVQILTKFGLSWDSTEGAFYFDSVSNDGRPLRIYKNARKEAIVRECETSLRLLKTDYIDLYQIHWNDPTTPIAESMEAVQRLMEHGKVRYAGVCNYSPAQMEEAEQVVSLVSNQMPYSMVRRDIEHDVVPYCLEHGKSILAYSPLQRGLLTGKITPETQFSATDTRASQLYYKPENIRIINRFLDKLRPLAESKGATIGQLVIRWTVEQPGITIALVGARNVAQSQQNAQAASIALTTDEVKLISDELGRLRLVG